MPVAQFLQDPLEILQLLCLQAKLLLKLLSRLADLLGKWNNVVFRQTSDLRTDESIPFSLWSKVSHACNFFVPRWSS